MSYINAAKHGTVPPFEHERAMVRRSRHGWVAVISRDYQPIETIDLGLPITADLAEALAVARQRCSRWGVSPSEVRHDE